MRIDSTFIYNSTSSRKKAEESHYEKAYKYNEKLKKYENEIIDDFNRDTTLKPVNIHKIEQINNDLLIDLDAVVTLYNEYCNAPFKKNSHIIYLEILCIKYGMNVIHTGYVNWYSFKIAVETYEHYSLLMNSAAFSLTLQDQQDEGISSQHRLKEMNYCKFNFARQIAYFNLHPPIRHEGIIVTKSITDEIYFAEYEKIDQYNISDILKHTITNMRVALKICKDSISEAHNIVDVERYNRHQDEMLLNHLVKINSFFNDPNNISEYVEPEQLIEKYKAWLQSNGSDIPDDTQKLIAFILKSNTMPIESVL